MHCMPPNTFPTFLGTVLWRYVSSRLINRAPPKETSFDAFLRPGARPAKQPGDSDMHGKLPFPCN